MEENREIEKADSAGNPGKDERLGSCASGKTDRRDGGSGSCSPDHQCIVQYRRPNLYRAYSRIRRHGADRSGRNLSYSNGDLGLQCIRRYGGAPLASIQLGKKNYEGAEKILGNSVGLLLIFSVILTVRILPIFKTPILYAFGASDTTIVYAGKYISIYLIGTIFVQFAVGLIRLSADRETPGRRCFPC